MPNRRRGLQSWLVTDTVYTDFLENNIQQHYASGQATQMQGHVPRRTEITRAADMLSILGAEGFLGSPNSPHTC